ncbi:MspA family porin [Nocardia rhamnosiphila]|uniref:MspA family porin n=1 Tax=Nocardia rhamnosiphila TaxID=426716 RepID=UPI00138E42A8|nr:MspA family porin [Nocardia rhamnosiphila]
MTVTAIGGGVAVPPATDAAPGEVVADGLRVVAVVDSGAVVPVGADTAPGVPFAHAVEVSGSYSVGLDSVAVRAGEIVVGYLVGCAVDVSNGISIGIAPGVSIGAGIAQGVGVGAGVTLAMDAPPGITLTTAASIAPGIGIGAGLAGALGVNLAPGTVTAAVIGATELDSKAVFPYTFGHTDTPLHVSGCLSPASAMPFVTARVDGVDTTVQTTGYGDPFWF